MSLTSRFGISLTFGLLLSLSTPFIIPAISHNSRFATAQAQTQPTAFSDVPADYWAHDYIAGLAKSNIISGFGDGTFRPNEPVTRAQFAAILRQAFLTSQPTTAQAFKDVSDDYWAKGAISSARSAGFLSGYPDNTFKPNDRILRVQALVSLANGLKYPTGNPQSLSSYKDADIVPTYARPSTAAAAQANLIVSYPAPDQISPNRAASRAEVAAFVYQALAKAGRVAPIALKPERRWQITPTTTIAVQAYRMSLSRNGQSLAVIVNSDPEIQVWNTQTGSLLRTLTAEASDSVFNAVAISQDGTKIAFIKTTLPTGVPQLTVQTVDDGKVLLTQFLTPPKSQILKTYYPTDLGTLDVAFSPDGKRVMTQVSLRSQNYRDGTVYNRLNFHDIATGEFTQSINLIGIENAGIVNSTFSPDGSLLARVSYADGTSSSQTAVDMWQRNKDNRFDYLTALPVTKDGTSINSVGFTDSNLLNLTTYRSYKDRLDTWNPQTGEQVQSTLLPDEDCITATPAAVASPDGTSYFSTYPGLGICLGNIQTGEFQRNLDELSVGFEIGVFSGDGDVLAAVSDLEIRIFTKAAP